MDNGKYNIKCLEEAILRRKFGTDRQKKIIFWNIKSLFMEFKLFVIKVGKCQGKQYFISCYKYGFFYFEMN